VSTSDDPFGVDDGAAAGVNCTIGVHHSQVDLMRDLAFLCLPAGDDTR
jgi:hypothetical protein